MKDKVENTNSRHEENNSVPTSELLTEQELIRYLRIPEISRAKNHHFVIENLKRLRNLPRIHICSKPLYPIKAIRKWIDQQIVSGKE